MLGRFHHALDAFQRAEKLVQRPDAEVFHLIGELLLRKTKIFTVDQTPAIDDVESTTPSAQRICLFPVDGDVSGTNLAEAKQYFWKAIENDGRQVESFRKLATIHMRESKYAEAIEMLESCVL